VLRSWWPSVTSLPLGSNTSSLQFFRMSTTYLALLRGINLGPKNKILMPDLVELFTKAGCKDVRTYIQSGNVIFEATRELSTRLPELISKEIQRRFGHKVPVMLRTTGEMREVVRTNPFLKEGAAEDILHVMFLTDLPKPGAAKSLDPDRSPPNRFMVRGKEIYLLFPAGFARTKLTSSYFDSKLGTIGTVRSWRTVTKLLELMKERNLTPRRRDAK
jgi:uncharacterized protein (DUF1697 family)